MKEITPNTAVKLSITKFFGIIAFILGLGFSGGEIYFKLTQLSDDVKEIHIQVKRIEEKLDMQYGKTQDKNPEWYTNTNHTIR